MIRLGNEWTELMHRYEEQHADPRNKACHRVGIPLIAASFPVGATVVGLPLAATMFTVGWGFQFLGHYFEGKKPAFLRNGVHLLVGPLWILSHLYEKAGLRTKPAAAA